MKELKTFTIDRITPKDNGTNGCCSDGKDRLLMPHSKTLGKETKFIELSDLKEWLSMSDKELEKLFSAPTKNKDVRMVDYEQLRGAKAILNYKLNQLK